MATTIYVKPILPRMVPASAPVVRAAIKAATRRVCDKAANELTQLVSTWNHKPKPSVDVIDTGATIVGTVQTEDAVMFYLDGGTSIRWAQMSNPFVPKTSRRNLRSGAGVGRAVIRGRKAMIAAGYPPNAGIEKREFSEALKIKLAPEFEREINLVLKNAIAKGQMIK